jgi:hypothetical protein
MDAAVDAITADCRRDGFQATSSKVTQKGCQFAHLLDRNQKMLTVYSVHRRKGLAAGASKFPPQT